MELQKCSESDSAGGERWWQNVEGSEWGCGVVGGGRVDDEVCAQTDATDYMTKMAKNVSGGYIALVLNITTTIQQAQIDSWISAPET